MPTPHHPTRSLAILGALLCLALVNHLPAKPTLKIETVLRNATYLAGEDLVLQQDGSLLPVRRGFAMSRGNKPGHLDSLDPVLIESDGYLEKTLTPGKRKGQFQIALDLLPNVSDTPENSTTIDLDGAVFGFTRQPQSGGYAMLNLRVSLTGEFEWKVLQNVGPSGYAYLPKEEFQKLSELHAKTGMPLKTTAPARISIVIDYDHSLWRLGEAGDGSDDWYELPHSKHRPTFTIENGRDGETVVRFLAIEAIATAKKRDQSPPSGAPPVHADRP